MQWDGENDSPNVEFIWNYISVKWIFVFKLNKKLKTSVFMATILRCFPTQ
jgi:hypothetical protein